YVHWTRRVGGLVSAQGGHVSLIVVGDGWYAEFEGGGGFTSGTPSHPKGWVRGANDKHLFPSDFADLGDNPSKEAITKALDRIKIKGSPQDRYQDDPQKGYYWKEVVTNDYMSASDELSALFVSFLKLRQLPYSVTGPNSNTYARALLENSGF